MKNFLVYKSSAGSGKTTILVKEYLKITLKNPGNFRNLLAITFTNKASREMKDKIILALKAFSEGNLDYEINREILKETGLTEDQIILKARQLLSLILHHYDEFSVSTIDSFVHQIVRSFASDLKLPQGFEVVIDENDIIPFIVGEVYDKLGEDRAFTEILLKFVLSQVDEEKRYDPTESLSAFIKKQLREDSFQQIKKLEPYSTEDFLKIIKKLQDSIYSSKRIMREKAREALDIIAGKGLDLSDFYHGKSGIPAYFERVARWSQKLDDLFPKSYVKKALEEDMWYSKGLKPERKALIDEAAPALKNALQDIANQLQFYAARRLVYDNIYELALLREIRLIFNDFTDKTQKVHISEFNKRIHEQIAGQPIPFIYERIGRKYKYFLIDEFQDTSALQWNNLLPLVEESLANGNFNMLVGDAKQAIYRFRGGEVELFTHLPGLYMQPETPENRQRGQTLVNNYDERKLEVNFRSREEIIRFNNLFFEVAGKKLKEGFDGVYKDHSQKLPTKKKEGGFVSIHFMEVEKASDFKEKKLSQITDIIRDLAAKNYPIKDICVLTRSNGSASEIAGHLVALGFPVVSSESLKLSVSPIIRMLVAFLKLLSEPKDQLAFAEFLTPFLMLRNAIGDFHQIFVEAVQYQEPLQWLFEKNGIALPLPEVLRQRSVYEILNEAARHLSDTNNQDLFLQYFLDFVYEEKSVYHGSPEEFVALWEEKKAGLSIVMPEGLDAIQVMTAHKAKGLKFGVVIAELYNNKNSFTKDQFWTNIDFPELEGLDTGLLKISRNLRYIGRTAVYNHESAKTELDFLNLVYVAFTRAVDALHVVCNLKSTRPDKFSSLMLDFLKDQGLWQEGQIHYEFGDLAGLPVQQNITNVKKPMAGPAWIPSAPWYDHLAIAPVEEVFWEAFGRKPVRTFGNLIHEMLSKITTMLDIDQVVEGYHLFGVIDADESHEIKNLLHHVIGHAAVKPYFQKGLFVKMEADILDHEKNRVLRPDRVVLLNNILTIIDYKTGEKKKEHIRQLEGYAAVFFRMGYQHIEKRLIYLNDEIEVVAV